MDTFNIGTAVIDAFGGLVPQLMPVAAVGLGISLALWGVPKALGFLKKTAK